MGKKTKPISQPVDCACVIHGQAYAWTYVDKLHSMLSRHLSTAFRLHVYTESHRVVPEPYIKHTLEEWPGISGPKKSWWYKMQLFNSQHITGNLLYFDLDLVFVNSLDWILDCSTDYFWTIHDFKRLVKKDYYGINSSIMYWNTKKFDFVWQQFAAAGARHVASKYRGDQDYIQSQLQPQQVKFFPVNKVVSWRWQALKGAGPQPRTRPDLRAGTQITSEHSVLVFHGHPKPHEIQDPVVQQFWQ